jgi:hypothetical protein
MHGLVRFFRSNPQALVLLVIFLILGIGAFIVVLISFATAGSPRLTGEPSGVIAVFQLLAG